MSDINEKQKPTTDAYRSEAERIFGKRDAKGGRKRWVYTQDGKPLPEPIEVSDDWTDVPQSTGDLGKFEYDNLRAPDGADISSRTKHRDYMKATGLAMASDFTGTWAKAKEQREAYRQGTPVDAARRREAVGRIAYELETRTRKAAKPR